ncbi:hypothetical protein CYY_006417 [Polysphondylium violaceum]|uniref:Uncharacterized protein n=1 Tax=Polysphondylium violaceum TaxID=133409 RepID=A0A8J4PRD6_9MYCE|nr:hypothetical protein CYY_006417 [Polysphondylium violaceum]
MNQINNFKKKLKENKRNDSTTAAAVVDSNINNNVLNNNINDGKKSNSDNRVLDKNETGINGDNLFPTSGSVAKGHSLTTPLKSKNSLSLGLLGKGRKSKVISSNSMTFSEDHFFSTENLPTLNEQDSLKKPLQELNLSKRNINNNSNSEKVQKQIQPRYMKNLTDLQEEAKDEFMNLKVENEKQITQALVDSSNGNLTNDKVNQLIETAKLLVDKNETTLENMYAQLNFYPENINTSENLVEIINKLNEQL